MSGLADRFFPVSCRSCRLVLLLLALLFVPRAAVAQPDSPYACLEDIAQAITQGSMADFEASVDVDGILRVVVDKFFTEAAKPENASQLPPMLSLMFSGAAMMDGGGRVRNMLRSEARAFVRNGIESGAFAGRSPDAAYQSRGLIAPLFADASLGRKEIHAVGKARQLDKHVWQLPFRVHDAGNGNDYPVVGRFARQNGRIRLVAIDNLDELFAILSAEAAALEE